MEKQIYNGPPNYIFRVPAFDRFMMDLKADRVYKYNSPPAYIFRSSTFVGRLKAKRVNKDSEERVYHLTSKNVTIKYKFSKGKEHPNEPACFWTDDTIYITLYGTKENIDEVEKIISQKASNVKKKELSEHIEELQKELQNEEKERE